MTLLLVDDEAPVVDVLMRQINWADAGVDQVLCAYSMKQARLLFTTQPIDVMVCDIEMPQGSGLDLLKWVRAENLSTVTIFLTGHATFQYAREALTLGSEEYLLKPILFDQLLAAVKRAVEKASHQKAEHRYAQYGRAWTRSGGPLVKQFYEDVFAQRVAPAAFRQEETLRHLEKLPGEACTLLQLNLFRKSDDRSGLEPEYLDFSLCNIAYELTGAVAVVSPAENQWVCVLPGHPDAQLARELGAALAQHLDTLLSVALLYDIPVQEMSVQASRLCTASAMAYAAGQSWYCHQGALRGGEKASYAPPPTDDWRGLIVAARIDKALESIRDYLYDRQRADGASPRFLSSFLHDFLQMLYDVLRREGLSPSEVFTEDQIQNTLTHAPATAPALLSVLSELLPPVGEQLRRKRGEESVVGTICQYIRANLEQPLTREDIAEHVNLSPEYLSRLFHREKDITLSSYIQEVKVDAAKRALTSGSQSISEIAGRLGYDNFAYFSKVFKKVTGCTPQEYRRRGGAAEPAQNC